MNSVPALSTVSANGFVKGAPAKYRFRSTGQIAFAIPHQLDDPSSDAGGCVAHEEISIRIQGQRSRKRQRDSPGRDRSDRAGLGVKHENLIVVRVRDKDRSVLGNSDALCTRWKEYRSSAVHR